MDLIADIGATNTRCALLDDRGHELAPEVFHNADFTGVPGLLNVYLDHRRASDRPKRAALAVAAPMVGDDVRMINIDWRFSQAELKQELDLSRLLVVNDFAAIAWALPHFDCVGPKKNRRRRRRARHDGRARTGNGSRRFRAAAGQRRYGHRQRRGRPCDAPGDDG